MLCVLNYFLLSAVPIIYRYRCITFLLARRRSLAAALVDCTQQYTAVHSWGDSWIQKDILCTSWSGHKTDIHSIVIFAFIWPYYSSKFGTMVPAPAARLHMSFWNSRWFRRKMPYRVNPVTYGDISIIRSVQNSEKSVERMTPSQGVNIPWGMAKRSISSPSPNSLSIKRYEVNMIRDTKLRYDDERPKILISQLNLSFFYLIFWHVIRIALVYTLPRAHSFFDFFSRYFFAKMSTGFFLRQPQILPPCFFF